jgi:T-lymphoma invasion and metastasis-inducing protein 1
MIYRAEKKLQTQSKNNLLIRNFRACIFYCLRQPFLQISDDDRMSLTTAISDEDDGESIMASPYKAKATGTAAASFNCTGAVRKAG